MSDSTSGSSEILVDRDGSVVTLTFMALTYTSADFKEGVRAFLEKRTPRWGGAPPPPGSRAAGR